MTAEELPPPSLATLGKTTAVAFAAALVILATIVLPAEYAIDPLGTGRMLGLTQIAAPPVVTVDLPKTDGAPQVPTQNGPIGAYPAEYKYDVAEIVLDPYEYIEYKYQLEKGATMLYSWTASAGVVHDMHADRTGGESSDGPAEVSFDKNARQQASGSYTAPFAGIHGWYWENPSGEPIKLRLTSAGFYSSAIAIRSDRSRHTPTLRSLDSLPPNPATATGAGAQ